MAGLIDAHIHWCLFGRPLREVVAEFERLEAGGFEAVVVFPLPAMGAPPERAVDLVPGAYRDLTGIDVPRMVHDDLEAWIAFRPLWAARRRRLRVLSLLDVRAWDGRSDLGAWWGDGHAGLKNVLVLEEDEGKMRMPALRGVPGIAREEYLDAHRAVFAAAAARGVPLVYHADLSLHAAFVEECLQAHPNLPVVIPHLGFSRRRMAQLLERFPRVMTDIASLRPFIEADPEAYRSFILAYPERVLLGSDAIACLELRPVFEYARCVRELRLPPEVEEAVVAGNARRLLGPALAEEGRGSYTERHNCLRICP
ncbi:MAG: amidohydrolase family protein [Deltaproteobacteria bacterium]|nr:amidohydrolase family protein [Deltaproteobacteria bacterium]